MPYSLKDSRLVFAVGKGGAVSALSTAMSLRARESVRSTPMSSLFGIATCLTPTPSTSNVSLMRPVQSGAANASLPFCCERTHCVWK